MAFLEFPSILWACKKPINLHFLSIWISFTIVSKCIYLEFFKVDDTLYNNLILNYCNYVFIIFPSWIIVLGSRVHSCIVSNSKTYASNISPLTWTWKKESEVAQSCPSLCDPVDCSPPGSSVHGILQARILEWVAISFSRGPSQNPGIKPRSPTLQADALTSAPLGKP